MNGYDVRLHCATWTNPQRDPRTDSSNPFLSAINPYANSLSGPGRTRKRPITARLFA